MRIRKKTQPKKLDNVAYEFQEVIGLLVFGI